MRVHVHAHIHAHTCTRSTSASAEPEGILPASSRMRTLRTHDYIKDTVPIDIDPAGHAPGGGAVLMTLTLIDKLIKHL